MKKIILKIFLILSAIFFFTENIHSANWELSSIPEKNGNILSEVRLKADNSAGIKYLSVVCETKQSSSHAEFCSMKVFAAKKLDSQGLTIMFKAAGLNDQHIYSVEIAKETIINIGKEKIYEYCCENKDKIFDTGNNPHLSQKFRKSPELQAILILSNAMEMGEVIKVTDGGLPEIYGIFKANNPHRFREFLMRFLKM
jgi:hypothetical protein